MISVWHLAAVCCIPVPNPKARFREQEILCQVDVNIANHAKEVSNSRSYVRRGANEKRNAATQLRG